MSLETISRYDFVRNPNKLLGAEEYSFYLEGISTKITLRFCETQNGMVAFKQSHYIHIPGNASRYVSSGNYGNNLNESIHRAMRQFQKLYQEGHTPNESWLSKNENF